MNRMETEINSCLCGQLIFEKGGKIIQSCEDGLFNKWGWENWTDTCRKMKLDHLLTSHTRINSKWIKDLNVRPKAIKIIKENIGKKISDITYNNFLSAISPQARETKEKINKQHLHQTKSFCTEKENVNKIRRQPTEWENIFTDTSDKGLTSKIYKVLTKLNTKKTTQLKNGQKTSIDSSPKRTHR